MNFIECRLVGVIEYISCYLDSPIMALWQPRIAGHGVRGKDKDAWTSLHRQPCGNSGQTKV